MEHLPDALVQYIFSRMNNAKDFARCTCVSKLWKESVPCIKCLYFPRNAFSSDCCREKMDSGTVIYKMIASIERLEQLVVYCSFSCDELASWLMLVKDSVKHLELRIDDLTDEDSENAECPSKLDCMASVKNLESLKLWGVSLIRPPKWEVFHKLWCLEIISVRIDEQALSAALCACPNLFHLALLRCSGVGSVSIDLPHLQRCKLDFQSPGDCSLFLNSPKVEVLEVQGCSWIRIKETKYLRELSIAKNTGKVYMVDVGNLASVEYLCLRGVHWCWDAISKVLQLASGVKHLFMKVEFTGDFEDLVAFPEIDLVDFFNSHPKLEKFDIQGAMFAALCQPNSLKKVDPRFVIPYLEEVVITVRSPLNAEQKLDTLESILLHGRSLKKMVIKILQMKSSHSSSDDFFQEVCKFSKMNSKIVQIQ